MKRLQVDKKFPKVAKDCQKNKWLTLAKVAKDCQNVSKEAKILLKWQQVHESGQ